MHRKRELFLRPEKQKVVCRLGREEELGVGPLKLKDEAALRPTRILSAARLASKGLKGYQAAN